MLKLDENEKLITVFRKHIFNFWAQISKIVLIAILPFAIFLFLKSFFLFNLSLQSVNLFLFFYFLLVIVLWNVIFVLWTDYYLDMWILTDKRLVDVEQKGLFSREISSLRLENIQDIKLEISGILNTFLNMGSVHVQTAGSEKEFVIHNAKNPSKVKELILYAHGRKMEEIKTVRVENGTAQKGELQNS